MAVVLKAVVLLTSASSPRKVLKLTVSQPSWQVARACGDSAKQASGMSSKDPQRIRFRDVKVVVFIWADDCKNGPASQGESGRRHSRVRSRSVRLPWLSGVEEVEL